MINTYFKNLWEHNKQQRQQYTLNFAKRHRNAIKIYLDLGCDNGVFTQRIAKQATSTNNFGIEINHKQAAQARGRGITVKVTDLNDRFPFNDSTFDFITADQVIEHLVDVDCFVSEIKRVLKTGGCAIIGTENLASFHNIGALILGIQPFTGPNISRRYSIGYHPIGPKSEKDSFYKIDSLELKDHKRVMTYKALVSLFRTYGFRILDSGGFGYLPFPNKLGKLFAKLDKNHSQFIFVAVQKL